MGPKQLAGVMGIITGGRDPDSVAMLEALVEQQSTALYATGRLWDDGVIDPLDTRRVLGMGLAAAAHAPIPDPSYGIFRM
jgi:3-methylcrotonyl-CoA carboxylase beta subunit